MTDYSINAITRKVSYSGSAGVGPYAFTFEIIDQGDVAVYKNATLLTLTTDYTVTINANGTGSVTLVSAANAQDTIVILGARDIERTTDFVTAGDLRAESLNEQLDSLVIFDQQIDERVDRSIRAPAYDPTGINMTLPSKADRANKVLQFDTEGDVSAVSADDFFGNAVLGANYVNNTFTGTGSQQIFGLTVAPGSKNNIQIYIDGVYQNKVTFSISGQTLTFTEAPPLNSAIECIIGESVTNITGDASAFTFTQSGTGAQQRTVQSKLRDTVSVKDFGAVGDGAADDTAAIQAAFLAVGDGGKVYFPEGTYITSSPIKIGNGNARYVCGAGRYKTKIENSSSVIFNLGDTNDASDSVIEHLNIRSRSGGGHCFDVKFSLSKFSLRDCVVQQDNPAKSLWYQVTGYSGGNTFERLHLIAASSGTMTTNPWYHVSNEITNGFVFRDIRADYSRDGYQFFKIDTSNGSSFNTNGLFQNITFELTYGGMIYLGGHRVTEIKNCASYDMSTTQTGHGIVVTTSVGGQASSRCLIQRVGRYGTGVHALDTGINDILLGSGGSQTFTIDNCYTSAAGFVFTVEYNNNTGIHISPVTGAGASYSNNSNVQYIDSSNGNTLQGVVKFEDGSDAAPSITNIGDENTGMYFPSADAISFATAGTQRATINSTGSFLVAKTTANSISTVGSEFAATGEVLMTAGFASGNSVMLMNRQTSDGDLVRFYQDNAQEGAISVSGSTVTYGGGHLARWSQLENNADPSNLLRGTVMSNLDAMCHWGDEYNEQLNRTKVSDTEGDVNVAGVFVSTSFDEAGPADFFLGMTGDFIIRIAQGTTVQRGDLLMSAGDGTAKAQGDDIVRNKTIAKVTSTHITCTYEDGSYCVPCVLMAC